MGVALIWEVLEGRPSHGLPALFFFVQLLSLWIIRFVIYAPCPAVRSATDSSYLTFDTLDDDGFIEEPGGQIGISPSGMSLFTQLRPDPASTDAFSGRVGTREMDQPESEGVRLLSFGPFVLIGHIMEYATELDADGGDIQAVSQLMDLDEFMNRVEWDRKYPNRVPPCDISI